MAYTVTATDGTLITTVADGTVNTTSTSLTLIGKNYAGYGIFLNENYVKLLENFSNTTPPNAPLTGQLWYDNVNDILKVYNSATNVWKPISSSISQSTAPSASISVTGDIWWDTANAQLKVWSGSAWITIGPSYTSTSGTSGPVTQTILDNTSSSHIVTLFYISNSIIMILSKDSTYTPQTAIPGFSTIVPGLNLISATTLTGAQFTGATTGASTLGGFTSSQFIKNTEAQTTNYALTAAGGLTVGSDLSFDSSSGTVAIISTAGTSNKNIRFDVSQSGNPVTAVTLTASTNTVSFANVSIAGRLMVTGNITAAGNITATSPIMPSVTNTVNIGSAGNKFANIYATYLVGTSVTAQYADLAERFESDSAYPAGTVVALGGAKEITAAAEDLTEDVFGVVSTRAAFLMNGDAGNDTTHPAVAVQGRVPVRVTGQIKKGDRLVSAGMGLARAADRTEITAFNVIGRSLQDKTTTGEGTVEAIVKLNS
jgi:hypothetical protein